jgi:H+-transporting ATPase
MVTGDSAVTAVSVARKVGIADTVCPPERLSDALSADAFGVFARVVPEEKYRLVTALQRGGHVVGMCGDGANDAPALRQAQIGIAVADATDVAKAAAAMVMTESGLGGIVLAVREGRTAFHRLLTYTLNMLVKKIEIVLFLVIGWALTGGAVMTPVLMVLLMVTNDFLSMSLALDRAAPSPAPCVWRMRRVTAAAVALAACKLGFSTAALALARFRAGLDGAALQTFAFAALAFGNQALLYAVRERRRLWRSRPGAWVLASSAVDIGIVSTLAATGILMEPLPWPYLAAVLAGAALFALVLDQVKLAVLSRFEIDRG